MNVTRSSVLDGKSAISVRPSDRLRVPRPSGGRPDSAIASRLSASRRKSRTVAEGPASHSSAGDAPRAAVPAATQPGASAMRRGMHSRSNAALAAGARRANSRAFSFTSATSSSRALRSVGAALAASALILRDALDMSAP